MKMRIIVAVFLIGSVSGVLATEHCQPTPGRPLGTHHVPVTVHKTDVGSGLVVSGRVLAAPDCRAVPGARIEHWQTNRDGVYVDELRAYLHSTDDGAYRFETQWPGAPIPHIHFRVAAEGYRTLVTQWIGDEPQEVIVFDLVLEPR